MGVHNSRRFLIFMPRVPYVPFSTPDRKGFSWPYFRPKETLILHLILTDDYTVVYFFDKKISRDYF